MTQTPPIEMDEAEREAFLGIGGTGVISFPSADGPPYSLPVSYGYDATSSAFYFRLAFGPETTKPDVTDGTPVSFVTYGRGERPGEQTDDRWRSVVATGRLEPIDDAHVDAELVAGMEQVHIPLVDIFADDPGRISFRFFRLDPDEMTGRKERDR